MTNKQKSKKVAVVYSGAEHSGGIETYLELLFENVEKTKIDLTLVSLGDWNLTRKLQAANYGLQSFSGSRVNPGTVFRIAKYLKQNHFDLVVSQGTVANAYARAASLLSGVPSLVTVHSDPYYDYPNPIVRIIYAAIESLTRFPTMRYIAVSEYLKKKLIASGINADKIAVIYNGVALPYRHSRHSTLRCAIPHRSDSKSGGGNLEILGQAKDDIVVIGSIGRLHKVKNYAELIHAFAQLTRPGLEQSSEPAGRPGLVNFRLQIAGEGEEREQLEQLIVELVLTGKVELLGNVDDVYAALDGWDIYIQPSLSEGFGLTVVEAMLAGKPVIVSPCGSLPELVENGKTGIVMTGASSEAITIAMSELVADKDRAGHLAASGQAFARVSFSVERWVKETEKAMMESAK